MFVDQGIPEKDILAIIMVYFSMIHGCPSTPFMHLCPKYIFVLICTILMSFIVFRYG